MLSLVQSRLERHHTRLMEILNEVTHSLFVDWLERIVVYLGAIALSLIVIILFCAFILHEIVLLFLLILLFRWWN